jgi:hypothetical protein
MNEETDTPKPLDEGGVASAAPCSAFSDPLEPTDQKAEVRFGYINSWGQPIIAVGDKSMFCDSVVKKHPILMFFIRLLMKPIGRSLRRYHQSQI